MSETEKKKFYCILDPRCRLCRFDIADGESAVEVAHDTGTICFPFEWGTFYLHTGVRIHMCFNNFCFIRGCHIPPFHEDCYKFVSGCVPTGFLSATSYQFHPTFKEKQHREALLQRIWIDKLHDWSDFKKFGLPVELLAKIASWSLREFAISWSLGRLSIRDHDMDGNRSEHSEILVDLSVPVYARYTAIDGTVYLAELRNSSFPGCRQRWDGIQAAFCVDIGSDDLGVRCLRITSIADTAGNAAAPPGLWWKRISRVGGVLQLRVITDGVKIRDLEDASPLPLGLSSNSNASTPTVGDTSPVRWSLPGMPATATILDLVTCQPWLSDLSGLRMKHIECNSPMVTGYSAYCRGTRVKLVCSHSSSDTNFIYKEVLGKLGYDDGVWIYFPMGQGESLQTIVSRTREASFDCSTDMSLIFETNRGKMTLLGPYIPPEHLSEHKFLRICSLPKYPSHVYFNIPESCRRGGTFVFGFQHEKGIVLESELVPCPEALTSLSQYPGRYIDSYRWFYSSCSLAGIREITVCRRPLKIRSYGSGPSAAVTGMLVRYCTGLVVSVGQVRLDSLGEPIAIAADTNSLGIRVGRVGQNCRTIADINVYPESMSSVWTDVIMVPQKGTLIWWFLPTTSLLQHYDDGRVSLLCRSSKLRTVIL